MKKTVLTLFFALCTLGIFAQQTARIPEIKGVTTKTNPVKTAAKAYQLGGDTIEVVVRVLVHPDHYIYSNVDPTEQIMTTDVRITNPKGVKKLKGMEKPQRQLFATGSNSYIYKGDCIFRQRYKGTPTAPFQVKVKYECHNANEGFQPQQVDYTLIPE